jgi:cytochrome c553
MRTAILAASFASLTGLALAGDLDWAYPPSPQPAPVDDVVQKQMPGSARKYTQAQIDAFFDVPDWYPEEHPSMPSIVAHGVKPAVQACARCHLPSGAGHPESSSLADLPIPYIIRQVAAFRNGERKGVRATNMIAFAKVLSDDEVRPAAEYFSALKPSVWTKVIETDTVPASFIGSGAMRFAQQSGDTEPIGNRIIVLPQDRERAESRDAHSGFVDYVPLGSIKRGEALVSTGAGGKTVPCAICHGPTFKGIAEIPNIAGRAPIYVFRQLNDIKSGNRSGGNVELMRLVVTNLTQDDMIAIAAYLGSREP